MSQRRPRILFVSENVTLAQVVRLVSLARSLDAARFEVHFACASFDELCFGRTSFAKHRIYSLPKREVFDKLDAGKRIYELGLLERYVREELALFERVSPDLVVGDFRLSLTVSAPLAGIPHAALINAYFSPYAVRESLPVPDHPIVRLVGVKTAERYFPRAVPHVFAHFARPVNALRKRYGLPEIGSLLEVLTHADYTLHPDVPLLSPTRGAPACHVYLGPVYWTPDVERPPWWDEVGRERPCAYMTLGSSGDLRTLPTALQALGGMRLDVMLANAGRATIATVPSNVKVAAFLPGADAARRSALVISNGGSSTGHQALSQGVPVIGIASNLDQYLAMADIERARAGILLRAGSLGAAELRDAVERALFDETLGAGARRVAAELRRWDALAGFQSFVDGVLAQRGSAVAAGAAARP